MTDFHICGGCRRSDIDVDMALKVREPCPHCGTPTMQSLRICAMPDCNKAVPVIKALPLCHDCGVQVAVLHASDASLWHAVLAERERQAEGTRSVRRNGLTETAQVYYVRLDADRIKIGFSSKLRARLSALRVHPSALLACEPGGRALEHERHVQFAAYRMGRSEDFEPVPALLEWIDTVRAERDVPDWAKVPDTRVRRAR